MIKFTNSERAFEEAQKVIPGGVNSPVRAFKSVGGKPIFMASGQAAYITDIDGNRYLDFVCSWGPLILGHAAPRVVSAIKQAAEHGTSFGAPTEGETLLVKQVIKMFPSIELLRLVSSGTEAAMSALRVARGFTGKNRVVKFAGCYHGHADSFLVAAGSGALTLGVPDSKGVTPGSAGDTLIAHFNDLGSVEDLFRKHGSEIAAIIVEPVAANMGVIAPNQGFLQGLREIATRYKAVLIFDEVITGFRLAKGGAQELFSIQADLTVLGKIIGGGLPVGAFGGRRDIMQCIAPIGPVYQAGTLSGNPLAVAAGLATLKLIDTEPNFHKSLDEKASVLEHGLIEQAEKIGVKATINRVGSLMTVFFNHEKNILNFKSAMQSNTIQYKVFFIAALNNGIYFAPSQFEAAFVSAAHSYDDIEKAISASKAAFEAVAALQ